MGMEQAGAAATRPASSIAGDTGLTLAGLIDVLDRADEVAIRRRPRPRRSTVHRPAVYRPGGTRPVPDRWDPMRTVGPRTGATPAGPRARTATPLRSVPPAPAARATLAAVAAPPPAPAAQPGITEAGAQRPQAGRARLRTRLRRLVRRVALWGAGPDGAYLAWGTGEPRPVYRAGAQPLDPPIVLRELPSTPTVGPQAASPARARRRPAPVAGRRWDAPLPSARGLIGRAPVPSRMVPPTGATGLPESRARAPAGIRGSPGEPLARGSPPGWPDTG
jgi:hypothetical protein